jgi:MurNAc alpha-1-phosphate uridylyltransferase
MFPVAILAGGLATRLRPVTESVPKALVDVAGKPFIAWQLEYLRNQGVHDVIICTGHLGENIRNVVGTGGRYGLRVRYSSDGPKLKGTGGALKLALPLLGEHFFVLYGDSYLPLDFAEVQGAFVRSGKPALMTIFKNVDRWDKSNVLFTDGRLVEYNKRQPRPEMTHIDYGLGLLSASVFNPYPSNSAFDLADLYQSLSVSQQLFGMEVHQRFYEIGSFGGLKEAKEYFLTREKV